MWVRNSIAVAGMVGSMCLFAPSPSPGASGFTVQIQGTTITNPTSCGSSTEIVISGDCAGGALTYNGFKIGPISTSPKNYAYVEAVEGIDSLRLKNAKITATQGIATNCNAYDDTKYQNCPDIFFWATFDNPPVATGWSPAGNVPFYREPLGSMKRGTNPASGSSFRIQGWVDDLNDSAGDNEIGVRGKKYICATAGCESLNSLGTTEVWVPESLPGQRDLKVRFWFGLKYKDDVLSLDSAHVANAAGGGGGNPVGRGAVSIANDPD